MIIPSLILGLAPGAIWLFYYLKKDLNPEPKRYILKVFIFGMLATIPALAWESFAEKAVLARILVQGTLLYAAANYFLIVAISEEFVKFQAMKIAIAGHREFDEPVDAMIYMITSAIGFATMENILTNIGITVRQSANMFDHIVLNTLMRFYGPTFLHVLCSAIVGYFFALAFFRKKKYFTLIGFFIAVLLHGLFDYFIILNELLGLMGAFALLAIMVFVVSKICFKHLKKEQIKNKR